MSLQMHLPATQSLEYLIAIRRGAFAAEKLWYNIGRWKKCPRDLYAM